MTYAGMTVLQRLNVSKRLMDFDIEVKKKDVPKVREILESLQLTKKDIAAVLVSLNMAEF